VWLAVLGLVAAASASGCAEPHPPNVLLISVDTLRPDMLGAYGDPRPISPSMDLLARDGVLFENARSPAPWTLPAHVSLLTGLQPGRHGVKSHDHALSPEIPTLVQTLARHGYFTAGVVNSHNLTDRYGLHRGYRSYDYVIEVENRVEPSQVEAQALERIERGLPEPFFLFLHFYDTHSDYRSLPQHERQFAEAYGGDFDGSTHQLRLVREGKLDILARDARHLKNLYAAGIRQMDDGIGRVLSALDGAGHRDDTLVLLTSDHGEEFLEHGGVLHGRTQYEEVLRIPLILRGPGVPSGARVAEPVSLVDVVPTLLGLLGLPLPEALDGIDLRTLWSERGSPALRERALVGEADHENDVLDSTRSVRRGNLKLIYDVEHDRSRLFDLASDPGEERDIAAKRPEQVRELRAVLDAYSKKARPVAPPLRLPALGEAESDRLRALGYLEGGD